MKKLFFVVTFLACIAPFAYSQTQPIQDKRIDFSTADWFWGQPGYQQPLWDLYSAKTVVDIILYANEMNGPMSIQNFAFQNGAYYGQTVWGPALDGVSIYIKHCGDTRFINPASMVVDTSSATKYLNNATVIPANQTINFRDWCVFALDKPFEYNGNDNIQITFVFNISAIRPQNFLTTTITYDAAARNGTGGAKGRRLTSYGTQLRYFPFTAFNKYDENGQIITKHTVIPYTDKTRAVLPDRIYSAPPAEGNTGTMTSDATTNYWYMSMPNNFFNCIYSPVEMGNGVFGDAERYINAILLHTGQAYPVTFDNSEKESDIPCEIYLRLTDIKTVDDAEMNLSPEDYYTSTQQPNQGWQKVYDGTYMVTHYNRKMRLPLMQPFKYDGKSNVELLIFNKTRRVQNQVAYYYQHFHAPSGNTTTAPAGNRPSRYAYTGSGVDLPTTWITSSVVLSAIWEYKSAEQILETINLTPPNNLPASALTTTEYPLFQAELTTSGTWNPRRFQSISFNIAKNVPQNIFERITVYTTGNNSTFSKENALPVASIEDFTAGSEAITITASPDNTNAELKDQINYYWIIAEINCARSTNATFGLNPVNSVSEINISGAAGTPFHRQNFAFGNGQEWPQHEVKFNVMTAQERYPARVCATREDNNYPVMLSENVEKIEWQRFENNTWTTVKTENAADINYVTVLNIKTSDVVAGLNRYQLIVTPTAEAAGTCVSELTTPYVFETSEPAREAAILVDDAAAKLGTPYYHCVDGAPLKFYANHTSGASAYEWQYRDASTGNVWIPIPASLVASATQREMSLNPRYDWTILRNSQIRVKVTSELACDITNPWIEYSAPVQLIVPAENLVTADLPQAMEICRDTRLVLAPQYSVAGQIALQWYRDTIALDGQTRATLVIPEVQTWDGGEYWLQIITLGCHNENGVDTISTGRCALSVVPGPEIVWQNTQTRANPGEFAILQIESDYDMVDSESEEVIYFQWYRHNNLGNIDIELADNNTYFGTTSNNLVITPLAQTDYTFNGDYYYCMSYGACGSGFGGVKSAPIYLLPGDNLSVISHPSDVAVCALDTAEFEFAVWANGRDTEVRYQWFLDGDTLVDDGTYSGATGPVLRVDLSSGAGVSGDFVCEAWFAGSDPSAAGIRSRAAVVSLQELDVPSAEADTVRVLANSAVDFTTDYLPNVSVLRYEIIFTDMAGVVDTVSAGAGFVAGYSISAATVSAAGEYILRLYGLCNSVDIAWILEVEGSDDGPLAPASVFDYALEIGLLARPNPASSELLFSFAAGSEGRYSAEILDLSGSVVWAGGGLLSGQTQLILDVNDLHLSNGSYVFRVNIAGRVAGCGFVVAR